MIFEKLLTELGFVVNELFASYTQTRCFHEDDWVGSQANSRSSFQRAAVLNSDHTHGDAGFFLTGGTDVECT